MEENVTASKETVEKQLNQGNIHYTSDDTTIRKDNSKIYFFIVAILALLVTNVYFYIKYRNSTNQNVSIINEQGQMEAELDRIELELDRVTKENIELTEVLKQEREEARVKIEELRAKLSQNEVSRSMLTSAQREIVELKAAVAQYAKEIEKLKSENAMLITERNNLKESVHQAESKATELENINHELENKVSTASALKISSININAIRVKNNGKESIETKAKHTDKLKIEFNISDNSLAKIAIYDVYLRIIEPNGNLLISTNNIFEADGVEMQYTERTGIEFNNDGKLYTIEWKDEEGFKSGTYTVMLYSNKGIMGKGTIKLL